MLYGSGTTGRQVNSSTGQLGDNPSQLGEFIGQLVEKIGQLGDIPFVCNDVGVCLLNWV